ncbi:uncharacterized protein HKW66_Vig0042410 [Vigna angularis]|uniref:Uncharacterized protein n=1 Tax=Phaseolus angularis TaxID=3914 RepID=A0A8T0KZ21_PHAAN|nr:uncharacterized protein HKW66_Vig0042410 [Vigna angularis]
MATSSLRPSQLRARFESRFLPPASFPVPDPCGGRQSAAGASLECCRTLSRNCSGSKDKISEDFRQMFCTTRSTTLQLWDVVEEYESNTMPTYRNEELQQVRDKYVCDWILDVDNVRRDEVLQDLGLM